jgi:hypothetical protein
MASLMMMMMMMMICECSKYVQDASVLIIKLHTEIVHLFGYNKAVYFSLLIRYCFIHLPPAILLRPSCIPEKNVA